MNRRSFLTTLLGGAAGAGIAATLDQERLLWIPGAKKLFIPTQASIVTQPMIVIPERTIYRHPYAFDVVLDLNEAAILKEGYPAGWVKLARYPGYTSFGKTY